MDKATQEEVQKELKNAGVSEKNIKDFQFYTTIIIYQEKGTYQYYRSWNIEIIEIFAKLYFWVKNPNQIPGENPDQKSDQNLHEEEDDGDERDRQPRLLAAALSNT